MPVDRVGMLNVCVHTLYYLQHERLNIVHRSRRVTGNTDKVYTLPARFEPRKEINIFYTFNNIHTVHYFIYDLNDCIKTIRICFNILLSFG